MVLRMKVTAAAAVVTVAAVAMSAEQAAVEVWTGDLISDAQAGGASGGLCPTRIPAAEKAELFGREWCILTAAASGSVAELGPVG